MDTHTHILSTKPGPYTKGVAPPEPLLELKDKEYKQHRKRSRAGPRTCQHYQDLLILSSTELPTILLSCNRLTAELTVQCTTYMHNVVTVTLHAWWHKRVPSFSLALPIIPIIWCTGVLLTVYINHAWNTKPLTKREFIDDSPPFPKYPPL